MKQQFFVGDSVRICDTPQESTHVDWTDLMDGYVDDIGTVTEVSEYNHSGKLGYLVDDGYYFDAKWLTIVERAWQKNTGKQPVDDDVDVLVKRTDSTISREEACMFDWYAGDIGSIVEWRIADSVSSNEEQPEAIPPSHIALGGEMVSTSVSAEQEWTDKHYDNNYTLTQKDIERGFVKIDPYFVSKMWKVGGKDDSGALCHCFKTIARFGEKNSREREIKALYAQIKCLAEIEGVNLDA